MPAPGTLDKEWIDQNYSYLEPRLGTFPLFEPSDLFYEDLAQYATDHRTSGNGNPVGKLFRHAGLTEIQVHFEKHIPNSGEFRFSQHPENADILIPVCIRIAEKYRQIKDPKHRGMAIGTILAHEITHYYVMQKKIRRETTDNERLTDLGLVILGFGKLWFNGSNLVVEDRSEQLGYLKPLDMTYAFMEYARKNTIKEERLKSGLSPEAVKIFSYWLGIATSEIRYSQQQEALDRIKETVGELAAQQAVLETDVQNAILAIKPLLPDLAAAVDNQAIINSTIHFWNIAAEDHRIMGAFVNAQASGSLETAISGSTHSLASLRKAVHDLGLELHQPAALNKDPAVFRKVLLSNRQALSVLVTRAAELQQQVSAVSSVHERCLGQMNSVGREIQETQAAVSEGRGTLKKVIILHAFLSGNMSAWQTYDGDPEIRERVALITRPGEPDPFATTEEGLREASVLASLPRHMYAEHLGRSSSLKEILGRTQTERDRAKRTISDISTILLAQTRILNAYLEGARYLESRVQDIHASCIDLGKDIRGLKQRQDFIYAWHDRLSITPQHAIVFAEITHAILSCSPEAEFSAITRHLAEVRTGLFQDVERVKSRKGSADILPLDVHTKALDNVRADFGLLSGRISSWMQIQQGYIDRRVAREQRSVGNLFRNAGDAILGSVRGSVTKRK